MRRRTLLTLSSVLSFFALFLVPVVALAESVPSGASQLIRKVNAAAQRHDYAALSSVMVPDFSWNFGGEASAKRAISEWKKQPGYLRQLATVTRAKCVYRKDRVVECPAKAGTSFRAGFSEIDGQWKMVYFVEGD